MDDFREVIDLDQLASHDTITLAAPPPKPSAFCVGQLVGGACLAAVLTVRDATCRSL